MRTPLLGLLLLVPMAAAGGPPPLQPVAPPGDPGAAEIQSARALAQLSAGEPQIETLQRAAAEEVDRADPARDYTARARFATLLPKVTAEYRHDETSNRVVGQQTSGEVDYLRLAPSDTVMFRASWDLGSLVTPADELTAAAQAQARARRRAEVVERVTKLFFERQRLRAALLLSPPTDPLARVQTEVEIARLTADLDALTAGKLRERAP